MIHKKELRKDIFHHTMICIFGREAQKAKVYEEVEELLEAIEKDSLENIKDELADVELCIPYLNSFIGVGFGKKWKIQPHGGKYADTLEVLRLWLYLYKMCIVEDNLVLWNLIEDVTSLLCDTIYDIYVHYEIDPEEIDKIKEYKKGRTFRRAVGREDAGSKKLSALEIINKKARSKT